VYGVIFPTKVVYVRYVFARGLRMPKCFLWMYVAINVALTPTSACRVTDISEDRDGLILRVSESKESELVVPESECTTNLMFV